MDDEERRRQMLGMTPPFQPDKSITADSIQHDPKLVGGPITAAPATSATRPRTVTDPELEEARRYANTTQGESRSRYYDAGKQYSYENDLTHPDEKHKGFWNRLLHGLQGAGMGALASMGQNQPGQEASLGRILGGAALGGLVGGVKPATADDMYNRMMVEPEAQRQLQKQMIQRGVEFERQKQDLTLEQLQGTLTGQRQTYEQKQVDEKRRAELFPYEIEERKATTKWRENQYNAEMAQAKQREQEAERFAKYGRPIPGNPGWWEMPDGTQVYRMPQPNKTATQQSASAIQSEEDAINRTPEARAAARIGEGEMNEGLKRQYGAPVIEELMMIRDAFRTATRHAPGEFTYGPNGKPMDEITAKEKIKELEGYEEKVRKMLMERYKVEESAGRAARVREKHSKQQQSGVSPGPGGSATNMRSLSGLKFNPF
jgi:hypothetical protein